MKKPLLLMLALGFWGCTAPLFEADDVESSAGDDTSVEDTGRLDVDDEGDAGQQEGEIVLRIVSPEDGAVVVNPVDFQIEAAGVHRVQLEADQWPLSQTPWDPEESTALSYHFSGTGYMRQIVLLGYDDQEVEVARDTISITVEEPEPAGMGTALGTFENTYYYVAHEGAYSGAPEATLYGPSCEPIAEVSASFANAACIEGTARLNDGRLINYYLPCSCGGPCHYCWSELDAAQFPWGKGSQNNPLEPLRSWAADTGVIPFGTVVYVEEWDGLMLPDVDGLGAYAHDGCFRADDVGGAISGTHVDFFTGSPGMWQALEQIFPTRSEFVVYTDSPRCQHL